MYHLSLSGKDDTSSTHSTLRDRQSVWLRKQQSLWCLQQRVPIFVEQKGAGGHTLFRDTLRAPWVWNYYCLPPPLYLLPPPTCTSTDASWQALGGLFSSIFSFFHPYWQFASFGVFLCFALARLSFVVLSVAKVYAPVTFSPTPSPAELLLPPPPGRVSPLQTEVLSRLMLLLGRGSGQDCQSCEFQMV